MASENTTKSKLREWRDALVFAVVVATLFRWSLAEAFVIPTSSMENSLLVGDYLVVSKIHYGSRTPRTPLQIPLTHQKIWGTEIPSYLDWIQFPSYRLPGIRSVERGEPVVFNVPYDLLDPTQRPVDLKTYLIKRCVAIGGDQVEVRDGQLYVNDKLQAKPEGLQHSYFVTTRDELSARTLARLGLSREHVWHLGRQSEQSVTYRMLLTEKKRLELEGLPFVTAVEPDRGVTSRMGAPLFPKGTAAGWDGDQYGPLLVPAEGMTIPMTDSTWGIYGDYITNFEGHAQVEFRQGRLIVDGKASSDYTFRQNYYFMMGDSRHNSLDSRYWGFVPEDHILGKPLFIWMSIEKEADLVNKVRWNRLLKRVE
ncbi:MAG: signal peptidase I [Cyclobacteriaceae bacterium]|jgi:signal peptidase I